MAADSMTNIMSISSTGEALDDLNNISATSPAFKRSRLEGGISDAAPSKQQQVGESDADDDDDGPSMSLVRYDNPVGHEGRDDFNSSADAIRTSSLDQPTMRLTGHKGSVYALAYDPSGSYLCSGSFDMTCLLWNGRGTCNNYNVLTGHKNAVLDVKWSADGDHVVTASADKSLGWFDALSGVRIKRFLGHDGVVNAVDTIRPPRQGVSLSSSSSTVVVSGSDDSTARIWDARVRAHVLKLQHEYQVTSVAFSMDGNVVYTGGIDNCIHAWEVRHIGMKSESAKFMTMKGHTDTITCISLSPDGTHVLSNSMDGTLRTWDVRPFVSGNKRHSKTFAGGTHNAEKGLLNCAWSSDGSMVSGGSADRVVHVWDELTTEELYYLPGHAGCVNAVTFHPHEDIIASGSSDKLVFVGELSH